MGKKSKGKKKGGQDARTPSSDVVQQPHKPSVSLSADAPEWHPPSVITSHESAKPPSNTVEIAPPSETSPSSEKAIEQPSGEEPATTPTTENSVTTDEDFGTTLNSNERQQTTSAIGNTESTSGAADAEPVLSNGSSNGHAHATGAEAEVFESDGSGSMAADNNEELTASYSSKSAATAGSDADTVAASANGVIAGEDADSVAEGSSAAASETAASTAVLGGDAQEVGGTDGSGAPASIDQRSVESSATVAAVADSDTGDAVAASSGRPAGMTAPNGVTAAASEEVGGGAVDVEESSAVSAEADQAGTTDECAERSSAQVAPDDSQQNATANEVELSSSDHELAPANQATRSAREPTTKRADGATVTKLESDNGAEKRSPAETAEVIFKTSADSGFARTPAHASAPGAESPPPTASGSEEAASAAAPLSVAESENRPAAEKEAVAEGGETDEASPGLGAKTENERVAAAEDEDCGGSTDEMTSDPTEDGSEPDLSKGEDSGDGVLAELMRRRKVEVGVAVAAAAVAVAVVVGATRRR